MAKSRADLQHTHTKKMYIRGQKTQRHEFMKRQQSTQSISKLCTATQRSSCVPRTEVVQGGGRGESRLVGSRARVSVKRAGPKKKKQTASCVPHHACAWRADLAPGYPTIIKRQHTPWAGAHKPTT